MSRPIQDLRQQIETLPDEFKQELLKTLVRVEETQRRRKHIARCVEENLNQLRLDVKYLLFDLECTRRERDEARNAMGGDLS